MNIRHVKAIIIKESLQIIRDPSAILIAFFMPILLLFIFGYSVNLDSNKIEIGLVTQSNTKAAKSLVTAFRNSRFFDVAFSADQRDFYHDLVSTHIRGIVVIPQDFHTNPYQIQVITDGSEPNIAQFVANYSRGIGEAWLTQQYTDEGQLHSEEAIRPQARFWFNPELKSRNFLVPGSIAIIMTLIGTLLTSLVISREWERGTMEALMATPISNFDLLFGKLITYYLLAMASMFICTVVAHYYYQVPLRGSIFALAVATTVFLFTALSFGLLISTMAKNQFLSSQIAIMAAFLPGFILSGFIFEISAMPNIIQAITYLIPARYFVTSLQTIFLVGDVWPLLLKSCIAMLIFAVIVMSMTLLKTRKRLD